MLERVKFFCFHGTIHLFLYTIPRSLFALFVRLPVSLFELITFKRPFTYSFKRERVIKVVVSETNEAAAVRMRAVFGVDRPMRYTGPMYNGNIHTVIGASRLPRRVAYDRELLDARDGNPICLDWLRVPAERAAAVKGLILMVPGLGNYSQTPYMQRLVRLAVARGYHVCVLTPRGMGSAPLAVPNITAVTMSDDVSDALVAKFTRAHVRAACGGRDLPLVMLAYSCGANTMLKGLAEEWVANAQSGGARYRDGFPVTAAISMVAPTDLGVAAAQLRTPMGKALYSGPIFSALRRYFVKHKEVLLKGSEGKTEEEKAIMSPIHVDFDRAWKLIKDPRDVDRHVVVKHFGYVDEQDYYRHGFAPTYVNQVTGVPILYLVCRDDPTTGYPVSVQEWQDTCNQQDNLVYVEAPTGGHLGFAKNPFQEYRNPVSYLQLFPLDRIDAVASHCKNGKLEM